MDSKYKRINDAVNILGLPEFATLEFIKRRYKELSRKWHPDKCRDNPETCHQMMQKINEAYKVIIDYCDNYKYSFKEEDVRRTFSPEELWYERFRNDSIWGKD